MDDCYLHHWHPNRYVETILALNLKTSFVFVLAAVSAQAQIVLQSGVLADCNRHLIPTYTYTTFAWQRGVKDTGTYPLSTVSNTAVLTPNGSTSTENDLATHRYHHHTRIFNSDGTTWLAFSSGCTNEQDGGQQVAACWSTNKGVSWSSPVQIVPSMSTWINNPNTVGSRICYPRNFSSTGGTNYLVSAVDDMVTAQGLVHGAALLACPVFADGTIGTLFRISAATCADVNSKPVPAYSATVTSTNLMANSKIYGVWGGSSVGQTASEWVGFYSEGGTTYAEPNTFSADGGTNNLYRLWRSGALYINQAASTNGGVDWLAITNTSIPNTPSETTGVRLNDGRFAILGNPQTGGNGLIRDPLFLAVTAPAFLLITNISAVRQGLTSSPTYAGSNKTGGASYVSAVQVGNYLYVGYSMQKESIGFSRVLIPGLADNNND